MKLKAMIKGLEEVDENLRDMYVKDPEGDGFILDLEEKDFKGKLGEFRNNNRALHKQVEDLKEVAEKYKGVDLEKYEKAMELLKEAELNKDKELIDKGEFEELFKRRTETMRSDYDGKIKSLSKNVESATSERDSLRGKLESVLIDTAIQSAVNELGAVRKGAMEDIFGRARKVWHVDENGELIPMREGEVWYGKDGSSKLSMSEYAQALLEAAPHLFEGSKGGGSQGSEGGGGGKSVATGDAKAFGRNLEGIASGKVRVG